jgi:hypothetical protein
LPNRIIHAVEKPGGVGIPGCGFSRERFTITDTQSRDERDTGLETCAGIGDRSLSVLDQEASASTSCYF